MRILRLLLVASALFAGACTVSLTVEASLYAKPTTYVVATEAPPPPREDVTPGPRPSDASVWVEGHWSWNGRWEWTPGAWKEPREGHVWEPPVCVVEDGRYEFFPGYFRPREEEPPPVYREPGHVQLHVPAPDVRPSTQLPDRIVVRPGVELPRTTGPGASPDVGTHPVDTTPTLPGGTDLTTPPDTTPPETTPSTQQPPAMECALAITRAPRRNARFTVNGQGFDDTVVVQVAGTVQVVRAVTPTSLEAQTDRAGEVVLVRGEERVSCGRLELF
ncbi:MAG: YXWGXW repeat-containing protein [Sandaracinus sp.]|nr:YXWGXW repeat-containing protein [Sandaracinus sp.]MCB9625009.1 YXWGXW repeat-containing protein [Sandaracinus sp.]